MFHAFLEHVSGSPFTYPFLFLAAALDAVVPLVPSETMVITGGVVAADGGLILPVVILAAALGAFVGDNVSYWIGRKAGDWLQRRLLHGRRKRTVDRAERMLSERGGYLIVVARFIPGGRTAITLAAGLLAFPWRRFVAFDAVAGLIWATYAALLGYFGGKAFEERPLVGLVVALAVAFGVTALVETARWARNRRRAARA